MLDRRKLVLGGAAGLLAHPAIARALAIDADVRTGTLKDVAHVVILMQENRSFDHYFGSCNGVRGFADRFPIPVSGPGGQGVRTVWTQACTSGGPAQIAPFHLDTISDFPLMRAEGTPHTWPDAQAAWDNGRVSHWPDAKTPHAMGYYRREDIPFQFALADAFTLCDAYHCSIQTGTNSNRLFLWSGTNGPSGREGGPAIGNSHDSLVENGGAPDSYGWTTYVERLQAAGISWRVYEDMADNFTDNPLVGFKSFRDAHAGRPGADPELLARGMTTQRLDRLKADVLAGTLPQVSYIVAPAKDSEHPAASSPAQGADYTARVLDALTADPKVWSRTVLLVMFDENDGLFDHMPPPAPPARLPGGLAGASSVDTTGEYHLVASEADKAAERPELMGRAYGLGPRVPCYVVSPWSRGGRVNSQVFDHTSVIRFLEARFGVAEPNISPWRRAVCGDLTSAFDFKAPNDRPFLTSLPQTAATAARAAALPGRTTPQTPEQPAAPVQAAGPRPACALPYTLDVRPFVGEGRVELSFMNSGAVGAVIHVYDRLHLDRVPRRYTVEAGHVLSDGWGVAADHGAYDLWALGPNGFHRHFGGHVTDGVEGQADFDFARGRLLVTLHNGADRPVRACLEPMAYGQALRPWSGAVGLAPVAHAWSLAGSHGWYDMALTFENRPGFLRRWAGRLDFGQAATTDPAMGGPALMTYLV